MSLQMVVNKSMKMELYQNYNVDVKIPYGPEIDAIAAEIKEQRDQVNNGYPIGDPRGNPETSLMVQGVLATPLPGA